jgi:hypothetical protein
MDSFEARELKRSPEEVFWENIKAELPEVYNMMLHRGSFSGSQKGDREQNETHAAEFMCPAQCNSSPGRTFLDASGELIE